ncbi:hypothetical protein ACJZ2D_013642 [Fusarium nematophilum]
MTNLSHARVVEPNGPQQPLRILGIPSFSGQTATLSAQLRCGQPVRNLQAPPDLPPKRKVPPWLPTSAPPTSSPSRLHHFILSVLSAGLPFSPLQHPPPLREFVSKAINLLQRIFIASDLYAPVSLIPPTTASPISVLCVKTLRPPTRFASLSPDPSAIMSSFIDWSKTTRSKNYHGSGSFATFMIIAPVCFFLGVLFASFPYDFPLLWTKAPVPDNFFDHLETHLKFVHQSPPLISRMLHIIISIGFIGFFIKLFRPSEANFLFDGASLILYLIGFGVYVANIIKALRSVSAGIWTDDGFDGKTHEGESGELILGREDSLKVLAASNTILALVLVGILVLQAGQWYAEKKEADDAAAAEVKAATEKKEGSPSKAAAKKKQ